MKLVFTLVAVVGMGLASKAQCPEPALPGPEVMWLPNAYGTLPNAYLGDTYTGHLQLFVPADSAYNLGGDWVTVDVIGFWVDSILGLPSQFTYESDPSEGFFAGGYPACIKFFCNEVSDPSGEYVITVHFTAQINFGANTVYAFTHPIILRIAVPESVIDGTQQPLAWLSNANQQLNFAKSSIGLVDIELVDFAGRRLFSTLHQIENGPFALPESVQGIVMVRLANGSYLRLIKL